MKRDCESRYWALLRLEGYSDYLDQLSHYHPVWLGCCNNLTRQQLSVSQRLGYVMFHVLKMKTSCW